MMNHDPEMLAFRRSQELLKQNDIEHRSAAMVLFAMLMFGLSYSEAVKQLSEYMAADPMEVSQKLDTVVQASGHGSSAAALLNELYRREVANAD